VLPLLLLIFGAAIAIGLWRRASPVEWIWLLFAAAITMLVLWVLLVVFVVGPEMRRSPLRGG
jgi:predicted MFS family arabinose efflux permease